MLPYAQKARRFDVGALVVLTSYPGEPLGAMEAAALIGEPWRSVAYALRRLAARGVVEESFITVRGTARAQETRRLYRLRGLARHKVEHEPFNPFFPRVFPVPPGVARTVYGRCSLGHRWQKDEFTDEGAA